MMVWQRWSPWGIALVFTALACAPEPPPEEGRRPASVALSPESTTLGVGARLRLDARALDRNGVVIPEAEVVFSSSDPSVAMVDAQGWVEALRPGEADLHARAGRAEATARIRVRPKVHAIEIAPSSPTLLEDEVLPLGFTLLDGEGAPFEAELEARWRSENGAVAKVDKAGLLTAVAPGETRIVVEAGEGEGAIIARVEPRADALSLWSPSEELIVGESVLLRATILDRRGAEIERPLVWASDDPAVVRVDAHGRIIAEGAGLASIRAEADGVQAEISIRVLPAVARLEIVPQLDRLYVGGETRWTALAFDAEGAPIEGRRIDWRSEDPEVAEVVAHAGRVRGVGAGTTTITARSGMAEASAPIEVHPAPRFHFPTSPPLPWRAEPGFALPFSFEVETEIPLPLEWSSSDPEVARFAEDRIEVVGLGNAVVRAETGGILHEFPIEGSLRFETIALGDDFGCGVTEEARVWCWGANLRGQLGDGNAPSGSHRPVRVALDPEVHPVAITAGSHHACVLSDEGRAFCWGDNRSGGLGAGTEAIFSDTPLASAPAERFVSLSAGNLSPDIPDPNAGAHTCGLTVDGRALCWGNGRVGQLGDGNKAEASTPVAPEGDLDFVQLLAGAGFTCGLDDEGQTHCWGQGSFGTPVGGHVQTSTTPRLALHVSLPVFPPVPDSFDSIAVGWGTICGITPEGLAYCWGKNRGGVLGSSGYRVLDNGTYVFPPLSGGSTPAAWSAITIGSSLACGLDDEGSMHCWGRDIGVLDIDSPCSKPSSPSPEVFLPPGVRELAIGRAHCADHACVLDEEGIVRCWGTNAVGQAGQPPSPRVPEPTALFPD